MQKFRGLILLMFVGFALAGCEELGEGVGGVGEERITALETELGTLREEFGTFREQWDGFYQDWGTYREEIGLGGELGGGE